MNDQDITALRWAPGPDPGTPIYLRLYGRFREAIAAGRLAPGQRVPSVRGLASALNVARGTVEMAYQMLASEGYFIARGAAGTIVAPGLANVPGPGQSAIGFQPQCELPGQREAVPPFQLGLPALDAFPRKTWARVAGRTLRTVDTVAMTYPHPAGHEPLRRAIAGYLGIARGIACTHEQVFVTAGYGGALDLVCRTLLRAGDTGWYEDPGYLLARRFLEHAGMRLAPVPVDGEGIDVAAGVRLAAGARFAVVTPTHQSPTGVALSLPRRLALLDWARERGAWIVEDDYDSEFRYHGRPLPALKSLDADGRVLYTGTFSKVLFPGLRLAYLVVPPPLVDRFGAVAALLPGPGSIVPQAMVTAFMEEGHFSRHLRRMRALYAARRRCLVDALAETMGDALHVQAQAGGIHVLAHLRSRHDERHDDRRVAVAAEAAGLAVGALGDWRMRGTGDGGAGGEGGAGGDNGLLMGFTNFATPDDAMAAVLRLAAVMRGLR